MCGELSINIQNVKSDPWFVRPDTTSISNDLSMKDSSGDFLHITGIGNDWGFLALELLQPIISEGSRIAAIVKEKKQAYPPAKAVMLGINDKRIMDIYYGGKDKCTSIYGLPVIVTDQLNQFSCLQEIDDLPFV